MNNTISASDVLHSIKELNHVRRLQTHLQSSTPSYYVLSTRIVKVTRRGERILPPMPNLVGDLGKWMKECQAELQELLELEIDHVVIF